MKLALPFAWGQPRKHRIDPLVRALLQQTEQLMHGAQAVNVFMDVPTKEHALRVYTIEKTADEVRRLLIVKLKKSFITPIDREDLFSLSRAIDDVLDYLFSLVREMYLLQVPPNAYLKAMAKVLMQCASELHQSIRHIEHHTDLVIQHSMQVRRLENRMDTLYITAFRDLFQHVGTPEEMVNVLKLREIYRHMIHAVNSAELAANLINDVLVKLR